MNNEDNAGLVEIRFGLSVSTANGQVAAGTKRPADDSDSDDAPIWKARKTGVADTAPAAVRYAAVY